MEEDFEESYLRFGEFKPLTCHLEAMKSPYVSKIKSNQKPSITNTRTKLNDKFLLA